MVQDRNKQLDVVGNMKNFQRSFMSLQNTSLDALCVDGGDTNLLRLFSLHTRPKRRWILLHFAFDQPNPGQRGRMGFIPIMAERS